MYKPKSILITGGCGFIASNFLLYMTPKFPEITFVNIDKLDYCSTIEGLTHLKNFRNYWFYPCDISNSTFVEFILERHNIDTIIHFAAQTHVDNSFGNSICFTKDNILGTHNLLEVVRKYGKVNKFIHVSTDEVYGEVSIEKTCSENSLLNPTNPYAASKAGAEFIVKSYYKSYNIPIVITRGNNVYGPGQYPEKLIPKFILQLLNNKKMTIHGLGNNIRNFIFIDDVVSAFETILFFGRINDIYNIGTKNEHSVLDVAKMLHELMLKEYPLIIDKNLENNIQYVEDRLFNDYRYCIDSTTLNELGWTSKIDFSNGLEKTIQWYKNINLDIYFKEKYNI